MQTPGLLFRVPQSLLQVLALQLVLPNRSSLRFFGNSATVLVDVMHLVLSAQKFMAPNYFRARDWVRGTFLATELSPLLPTLYSN